MKLKTGKYLPRKNTPKSERHKDATITRVPDAKILETGFGHRLRTRKKRH